jgi:signal peptidase
MSEPRDEPDRATGGTEAESTAERVMGRVRRADLRTIANWAGVVLLVVVVVPFVLHAVPGLIGAEASYVVTSPSMEPALNPHDVIFVNEVAPSAVEEGDIVNFRRGEDERTTTHRVIEVVERDGQVAFRTAGDNNEGADAGLVTPEEFGGRVMTLAGAPVAIPQAGRIIGFTNTRLGFALLFVLPVTVLVVTELWSVVSSARATETAATDGGEPDAGEDGEGGSAVSLSANELTLAIAVLGAFVLYGGWTTSNDLSPLNVGVTGSALVALLMLVGLYVVGSRAEGGTARAGPGPESVVIRPKPLPDGDDGREPEAVSRLEDLFDVPATADGIVWRDTETGTYHRRTEENLVVYHPGRGAESAGTSVGSTGEGNDGDTAPQSAVRRVGNGSGDSFEEPLEGDDD